MFATEVGRGFSLSPLPVVQPASVLCPFRAKGAVVQGWILFRIPRSSTSSGLPRKQGRVALGRGCAAPWIDQYSAFQHPRSRQTRNTLQANQMYLLKKRNHAIERLFRILLHIRFQTSYHLIGRKKILVWESGDQMSKLE